MTVVLDSLLLLVLFAALGVAANFVVKNIKYIATVLKIKLFAFGILLGLITTLPELSVGINATIGGVSSLSVGNLLSGSMVIFGLILGASVFLNGSVPTDGRLAILIPQALVILSPIPLGLDGRYGPWDGVAMVALYFGLVYYLYRAHHTFDLAHPEIINRREITKAFFLAIAGVVFVLLASHWIVVITTDLLQHVNVSRLLIGVLVFAIGTNLPEITITIVSWRKKASDLSLSHLISSAFTNVLVLGVLATLRPITFGVGSVFWTVAIFLSVIMIMFVIFHTSGRRIGRREGLALLAVYALFLMVNVVLLKL